MSGVIVTVRAFTITIILAKSSKSRRAFLNNGFHIVVTSCRGILPTTFLL
jgi:hypothetical protein